MDELGAGHPGELGLLVAEFAEHSVNVWILTAFIPLLNTQLLSWDSSVVWDSSLHSGFRVQQWRLPILEFGRQRQANHPGLLDKFEAAERASL